jgi:hypothetical protein
MCLCLYLLTWKQYFILNCSHVCDLSPCIPNFIHCICLLWSITIWSKLEVKYRFCVVTMLILIFVTKSHLFCQECCQSSNFGPECDFLFVELDLILKGLEKEKYHGYSVNTFKLCVEWCFVSWWIFCLWLCMPALTILSEEKEAAEFMKDWMLITITLASLTSVLQMYTVWHYSRRKFAHKGGIEIPCNG